MDQKTQTKPTEVSSNPQIQKLLARLGQEIDTKVPANPIFFIVDFLCKHYPVHLAGFSSIWNADAELEQERVLVTQFFQFNKLPMLIASHFTNAGFDTLDIICSLTSESLDEIELFNSVKWLPGHKVRLVQLFSDIVNKVRHFRQEKEKIFHINRQNTSNYEYPTIIARTNVPSGCNKISENKTVINDNSHNNSTIRTPKITNHDAIPSSLILRSNRCTF